MNIRGGSRTAATSKMERFQPLTIITKRSILDVAVALDPPMNMHTDLLFQLSVSNFTHFPEVTSTN